ncbi:hypothetical protein AHF37_01897 [Paragonimus kellicotti]|nr:hypothetical protein AHF37_01897 [Paragonimus kellicotti]
MPKTFFIGDHYQMFPHLRNRVILESAEDSNNGRRVSDSSMVVSGVDIRPLLQVACVREVTYGGSVIESNGHQKKEFSHYIKLTVLTLASLQPIQSMIRSNSPSCSINGVTIHNGLVTQQTQSKVSAGEEVPRDMILTSRQHYGLPEEATVFCNFNQLYKIDPSTMHMWVEILKSVPNSVLWLLRFPAAGEAGVLAAATEMGLKARSAANHFQQYVCLDTPLCNGHTTGMDVLWAGCPVVTLPLETLASRVAASQLHTLGCPELVATSQEDYVRIASKLGNDREYLQAMRAKYSEKLAYMPKTFFIGDHYQMFPHLRNRVILESAEDSNNGRRVSDSSMVVSGVDIRPLLQVACVREVTYGGSVIESNGHQKKEFSHYIKLTVLTLASLQPIQSMIRSNSPSCSINGVTIHNGLVTQQTQSKVSAGEEVPRDMILTSRQHYGLPEEATVFCNFNQLYKIDPSTMHMWVEILKSVPNSVLWLLRFPAAGEAGVLAAATEMGLKHIQRRIIFSNVAPKEEHVRRGQVADVCLDTPLCNGHTTGMDVLWAGCPVVTLPLETLASRVAASQLHTLGCPELVATSQEDYVRIASKLGNDREYLQAMRAKVWKARESSQLFNCRSYASDLENLYARMWQQYESGNLDHITD